MTTTAVGPTLRQRWRRNRWVPLLAVVVVGLGALTAYLTAPRPGGHMDPASTAPGGARALMSLLREHGVEVIEAADIAAVEAAARPDTLLAVVQTYHLVDPQVVGRLAALPGDRLLVKPTSRTREALAPQLKRGHGLAFGVGLRPDCDLREANRAGTVQFGATDTYEASGDVPVARCYDGALVRFSRDGRTTTVVGSSEFMANGGLLKEGNAALAMNLAGAAPRLIWYAPQHTEGESDGAATLLDLVPDRVSWLLWQFVVVVALLALWRARRVGPLVAERLPVVVRASETVEGRGRLYRSRRARDSAAAALRTAALQRMAPRVGITPDADTDSTVAVVCARSGLDPQTVTRALFGPAPADDAELVALARELDNIERQVAQS